MPNRLQIQGTVIDKQSKQGLNALRVEAWGEIAAAPAGRVPKTHKLTKESEKGGASESIAKKLGQATAKNGKFNIGLDKSLIEKLVGGEKSGEVYFKVYDDSGELLVDTKGDVVWLPKFPKHVTIEVTIDDTVYSVKGQIIGGDGKPLQNAKVKAYDKDLRTEELLGECVSDDAGRYLIRYRPGQFARAEKKQADLIVRVFDPTSDVELVASNILYNASSDETVDLIVGGGTYQGVSEYDTLVAELTPLLQGIALEDLQEDAEYQDITFLTNETGINRKFIGFLHSAAMFHADTEVLAEAFYGLFRQGLPDTLDELLKKDTTSFRQALEAALEENIVPLNIKAALDEIVAQLEKLKKSRVLDQPSESGVVPLRPILETAISSSDKQETLLDLYTNSEGPIAKFWEDLRQHPDFSEEGIVDEIQTSLRLGMLTHNHVPLVTRMKQALESGVWERTGGQANVTVQDVKDFAKLNENDWAAVIEIETADNGVGVPELTPGETPEEKAAFFAKTVAGTVEAAFPTNFVASRIEEEAGSEAEDMVRFFRNSPDFDLQATRVDAYVAAHPEALQNVADPQAMLTRLNKVQRIYRVTSNYEGTTVLLDDGLYSAKAISKLRLSEFTERYSNFLGGTVKAARVYRRAKAITASALTMFMKYSAATNSPPIAAIPELTANEDDTQNGIRALISDDLALCSCAHCSSVYSPAAYLVDILNLLKSHIVIEGNALHVLLARRPDLDDIELSCKNTDTLLPYIDLVNELLEEAVAPLASVPARNRQTTKTQAELLAYPEHLNLGSGEGDGHIWGAYEILATTSYPWDLPFHLWWEEVRCYLQHLGVDRADLMKNFQKPGEMAVPSDLDIATERLGFSSSFERAVITTHDTEPFRIAADWGLHDLDIENLNQVSNLLQRSGLDFEQLKDVLATKFMRDTEEAGEFNILPDPEGSATCDTTKLFVRPPLELAALDSMHRFVRLARKLGWSFQDTDAAISLWSQGDISDELVQQLAAIKQLEKQLKLPVAQLLDFWRSPTERETKFAAAMGLPPDDLEVVQALIGIAPYDNPESLLEFVKLIDRVQRSPFTTGQLNYLCRHEVAPGDPIAPLTEDIIRLLRELQDKLDQISTEADDGLLPTREVLEDKLSLIGSPEETAKIASFVTSVPEDTAENRAFIQLHFPYIDSDAAYAELLVGAPPATDEQKEAHISNALAFILRHLLTHLRKVFSESMIKQTLSSDFGLDSAVTGLLLDRLLKSRLDSTQPALNDYLAALGNGLSATYFSNPDLSGDEVSRTEENIDLAWGSGWPDVSFGSPVFSARFEGMLFAPEREAYTFAVRTSGGVRLWLNGELLIDEWDNSIPAEFTATRNLTDPKYFHSFRLEFTNATDDAFVQWYWTSPSTPREIVPKRRLFHGGMTSFEPLIQSYLLLYKAAMIIGIFKLSHRELTYLHEHADAFSRFDLNDLPLASMVTNPDMFVQWQRLLAITTFRDTLPRGDRDLFDLFGAAATSAATNEEITDLIAEITGWNKTDVEQAIAGFGLAANDFASEQWLSRLRDAILLRKRLGIEISTLFAWAATPPDDTQANAMRISISAKYDNAQWLSIARELRDPLRDRQRAALVSYLVAWPNGNRGQRWQGVNELYEHFLVDVEMRPCQLTSRLKLAISATQLFIQRCLMNLEPDVVLTPEEARHWREWMKNYRVWEANRKVFLYPENWIYPELRDDKSPFFEELEQELLQNEITNDSAEGALMNYLEKLDNVARLQICGMYHEEEEGADGKTDILHVVGRTFGSPAVYYYRQRVDGAYWTAWEKVDVEIEGNHLIPLVANRRLYLFWPIFTDKPPKAVDIPEANTAGKVPENILEINMAWTERRQEKWSAKRIAHAALTTASLSQLREDYIFKARIGVAGKINIGCYARRK